MSIVKNYEVIYINTFTENLIIKANKLKKLIGQDYTEKYKMFRNKKIQRELMMDTHDEITISFLKVKFKNIKLRKIEKMIDYPFIMKPSSGIESFNVFKVLQKSEYDTIIDSGCFKNGTKVLIEEFIT
jgi:D-alanine-D-alanine ligase-like ATP-grasp enzyme